MKNKLFKITTTYGNSHYLIAVNFSEAEEIFEKNEMERQMYDREIQKIELFSKNIIEQK